MAVLDLFLDLAALPSPPGKERIVADRLTAELRALGLEVVEDDAGPKIGSDAGNLYCRLPGTAEGRPLFFCAHMDTVLPSGPIEPVVEDGVVRNSAGTILGADNKAAVAAMVDAARRVLEEGRPHAGIELVFTLQEEVGLKGVAEFDCSRLAARDRLRLRHGGPDRRGRPRCTERDDHGGGLRRSRRPLGDCPRGRTQRDCRRCPGDLRHAPRPGRRGDDGERRHDQGRRRPQHRSRALHDQRRSALARRTQARRGRAGNDGGVHVRRIADGLRGRDGGVRLVQGLSVPPGGRGRPTRACRARAHRPRAFVCALATAARTRTSSTCAG